MKIKYAILGLFAFFAVILSGCAQNQIVNQEEISKSESESGKKTITGIFITGKGCMGIVDHVLLTDFANKCDEAEKYEGKTVEVTGVVAKYDCKGDIQCWSGMYIKDIESIKIKNN